MNILTKWLRSYLPELPVDDRQLAEDLTLRGIAVESIGHATTCKGYWRSSEPRQADDQQIVKSDIEANLQRRSKT